MNSDLDFDSHFWFTANSRVEMLVVYSNLGAKLFKNKIDFITLVLL